MALYIVLILCALLVIYFMLKGKYNLYLISTFLCIQFLPPVPLGKFVMPWGGYIIIALGFFHFLYIYIKNYTRIQTNVKLRSFVIMFLLLIVLGLGAALIMQKQHLLAGTPLLQIVFISAISFYVYLIDTQKRIDLNYVVKYFVLISFFLNFTAVLLEHAFPSIMAGFILKVYGAGIRTLGESSKANGFFTRASGLVYSSVLFGAGVCMMLFYMLPFVKTKFRPILYIIVGVMGILAFSKTFILGAFIGCFLFCFRYIKQLWVTAGIGAMGLLVLIVVGIGISSISFSADYEQKLSEYLSLEAVAEKASSERYDSDNNSADQLVNLEKFKQHPIFGNGYCEEPGVFLGDSTYTIILYLNGIVGMLIFLLTYFLIYLQCPIGSLSRTLIFAVPLAGFALKTYDSVFYMPYFILLLSKKGDLVKVK